MQENAQDLGLNALENRSRVLFRESVDGIDMPMRSRLTRARHAALEATASSGRAWFLRVPIWKAAAGMGAAAVLGVGLWFGMLSGSLSGNHGMMGDGQNNLEDLDIVASSDPASGDAIEMLQDDIDFYDFADRASNSGPAA